MVNNHQHTYGILTTASEIIEPHQDNRIIRTKASHLHILSYPFTFSFVFILKPTHPLAHFFPTTIAKPRSYLHASTILAHRVFPHSRKTLYFS